MTSLTSLSIVASKSCPHWLIIASRSVLTFPFSRHPRRSNVTTLTGSAIDNCAVYVVNAANEPVEAGEMGQVYVAGAHVADGYINRREMASFVANVVEDRKGK